MTFDSYSGAKLYLQYSARQAILLLYVKYLCEDPSGNPFSILG